MTPKDYINGLCRNAVARGVDPVEVDLAKQAALDACGGGMAHLAERVKRIQAINDFEDLVRRMQQNMVQPLSQPYRRIITEQDQQDLLRGVIQTYPEQVKKLLEEIHPQETSPQETRPQKTRRRKTPPRS